MCIGTFNCNFIFVNILAMLTIRIWFIFVFLFHTFTVPRGGGTLYLSVSVGSLTPGLFFNPSDTKIATQDVEYLESSRPDIFLEVAHFIIPLFSVILPSMWAQQHDARHGNSWGDHECQVRVFVAWAHIRGSYPFISCFSDDHLQRIPPRFSLPFSYPFLPMCWLRSTTSVASIVHYLYRGVSIKSPLLSIKLSR